MSSQSSEHSAARVNKLLELHEDEIDSWRIFKIMSEFVQGFEFLNRFDKTVTFFGTSRDTLDQKLYDQARELAIMLSKDGYTVVTGGGSGIMEAANEGAFQAGGESVGLNIQLPNEQRSNPYVKKSESFSYFFTRKVILSFSAELFIFFPGGYGTLDYFFEIATLVQTNKIEPVPIILVNTEFWEPLLTWVEQSMYVENKTINQDDMQLYTLVDNISECYTLAEQLLKGKKKPKKSSMRHLTHK